MRLPSLKFHIPRLFSAAVLWSLFTALVYINITSLSRPDNMTSMFLPALSNPFSSTIHMNIASTLWEKGFHAQAKQEMTLAQELTPSGETSVLGVVTPPSVFLDEWESQPKKLASNYMFWKTVLEEKSDYRDAFIQASIFAYELGEVDEARGLLQKAYDLDPNFPSTTTLLSKIKQ